MLAMRLFWTAHNRLHLFVEEGNEFCKIIVILIILAVLLVWRTTFSCHVFRLSKIVSTIRHLESLFLCDCSWSPYFSRSLLPKNRTFVTHQDKRNISLALFSFVEYSFNSLTSWFVFMTIRLILHCNIEVGESILVHFPIFQITFGTENLSLVKQLSSKQIFSLNEWMRRAAAEKRHRWRKIYCCEDTQFICGKRL